MIQRLTFYKLLVFFPVGGNDHIRWWDVDDGEKPPPMIDGQSNGSSGLHRAGRASASPTENIGDRYHGRMDHRETPLFEQESPYHQ